VNICPQPLKVRLKIKKLLEISEFVGFKAPELDKKESKNSQCQGGIDIRVGAA